MSKNSSKVLRKLPRDKAFYFFTSIGNYTGESASSLEGFVKKILDLNVKSLEFHFYRGDFDKWVEKTLEDHVLSTKIQQLKKLNPIGIDLRDRLYLIISKHYDELKNPLPTIVSITKTEPKTTSIVLDQEKSSEKPKKY